MTRDELLALHSSLTNQARELMAQKNADYTGGRGVDAFRNFNLCAATGACSVAQGVFARMCDKVARLGGMVGGHDPLVAESFEDTILDLLNYAVILHGVVWEEKARAQLKRDKFALLGDEDEEENDMRMTYLPTGMPPSR